MILLSVLFFFMIGCMIGSFLGVFVYRTVNDIPWVKGRSRCDHCHKKISWYDNVPVISYCLLGGKCRYCDHKIDPQYLLIEVATGVLFVWWYILGFGFFNLTQQPLNYVQPLFWLISGLIMLVIFFSDLFYYIIPDEAVIFLLTLTLLYRFGLVITGSMQLLDLMNSFMWMIIFTVLFFSLWYFTKGKGFGFGDVKLIIPLSLLLGFPKIVVAVFLSFLIGSIVGLGLIMMKKKKFGQVIPFGPFLIVASVIALIWSNQLLYFYWGISESLYYLLN